MNREDAYILYKLLKLRGVGPAFLNRMVAKNAHVTECVETGLSLTPSQLPMEEFLEPSQIEQFQRDDPELQEQLLELERSGTEFISILNTEYPQRVSRILRHNRPPVLSCQGNRKLLEEPTVGFCGSRHASEQGLEVAKDCVEQLVEKGMVIVSGNAAGIDLEVHQTCLEKGGRTIIVLAEGLLNFKVRKAIEQVWDWKRVLVISEFLPNAIWMPSRAMQRNATILSLSLGMVLIEAGKNGGSMDAGKKALAMGKRLYTPVYNGMPETATGNSLLIEQGAVPLKKNKKTGRANLIKLWHDIEGMYSARDAGTQESTLFGMMSV